MEIYMKRNYFSIITTALIGIFVFTPFVHGLDAADKETKFAEKIKSAIAKLGAGADAKIEVELKNGTKLKGYISEANEERFIVIDSSGAATVVNYPQARQINGNNWAKHIIIPLIIFAPVI